MLKMVVSFAFLKITQSRNTLERWLLLLFFFKSQTLAPRRRVSELVARKDKEHDPDEQEHEAPRGPLARLKSRRERIIPKNTHVKSFPEDPFSYGFCRARMHFY